MHPWANCRRGVYFRRKPKNEISGTKKPEKMKKEDRQMGIIAADPFAFNDDRSKFDLSRMFITQDQQMSILIQSPIGRGEIQILNNFEPISGNPTLNNIDVIYTNSQYNYMPFRAFMKNTDTDVSGIYASGLSLFMNWSQQTVNASVVIGNIGSSAVSSRKINANIQMVYVRRDVVEKM